MTPLSDMRAVQVPLAMDAIGSYVVAASAPLDIRVWRVDTLPASKLSGEPRTVLTLIRELSIMSVGQPLRVGFPQPEHIPSLCSDALMSLQPVYSGACCLSGLHYHNIPGMWTASG